VNGDRDANVRGREWVRVGVDECPWFGRGELSAWDVRRWGGRRRAWEELAGAGVRAVHGCRARRCSCGHARRVGDRDGGAVGAAASERVRGF
jgi:hypothetical protein